MFAEDLVICVAPNVQAVILLSVPRLRTLNNAWLSPLLLMVMKPPLIEVSVSDRSRSLARMLVWVLAAGDEVDSLST